MEDVEGNKRAEHVHCGKIVGGDTGERRCERYGKIVDGKKGAEPCARTKVGSDVVGGDVGRRDSRK